MLQIDIAFAFDLILTALMFIAIIILIIIKRQLDDEDVGGLDRFDRKDPCICIINGGLCGNIPTNREQRCELHGRRCP